MPDTNFRALVVREISAKNFARQVERRSTSALPDGDLLIRVRYSSLNYKDALSASGHRGVTRHYPHTPGIDAAGVVASSSTADFAPGDQVIVTGFDLGMNTPGGFGEYIRVPAAWVIKRPPDLSLRESMIYGTAGFTAAMSVDRLLGHGIRPDDAEILVTGATGGVGSIAVALLARLGFAVVAATGKADQHDFLRRLGASDLLTRQEVVDPSGRVLLSGRWAGVVDTVGGEALSTAIRSTRYGGALAACGNAASDQLAVTVYPFILRGVTLYGIDSVQCSTDFRQRIWSRLAREWKLDQLDALSREVALDELDPELDRILAGEQVGRVIVNLK